MNLVWVFGQQGQKVWDSLDTPLIQGLDHIEVLGQGGGEALRRKLDLRLGKPATDPARPELRQLIGDIVDDGIAGGVSKGLTMVDSRLRGKTLGPCGEETRWPLPRLALILRGISMLKT